VAASKPPPPGANIGAIIAHTPQKQLRRELAAITAATRAAQSSRGCTLAQRVGVTSYVGGAPGSDLLSILGVLRRPATRADRLNLSGLEAIPDVYRAYVRRALLVGGVSYYIVPARFDRAASIPSVHCLALEVAALDRELPRIPAPLREPTRELQAALIAWERRATANAPRDTICFVSVGGNTTAGECGTSPEAIKQGRAGDDNNGTHSGVVPDGVATVTLIFPAAAGYPERSVTTSVTGNVYAIHMSRSPRVDGLHPPTVIWRSVRGRVLKRIIPPPTTAAAQAATCKRNPVPCLFLEAGTYSTSSASGTSTKSVPGP
jgi:hypothetical protein